MSMAKAKRLALQERLMTTFRLGMRVQVLEELLEETRREVLARKMFFEEEDA